MARAKATKSEPKSATKSESAMVDLKYIGKGAFILGVPAADHSVSKDEAESLVESGLYRIAGESPTKPDQGEGE